MSNEWYTPKEYIDAVREVMSQIDLDPASCEFANRTIQATHYYTKKDNGLMHPWHGHVFLNPPYGKTTLGAASNLEAFTRYLIQQYQIGNVQEAILLIPVNTATSWFMPLFDFPIFFPKTRIRFMTEHGPSDGASFPTCLIYFGPNKQKFMEVFSRFEGRFASAIDTPKAKPVDIELWCGGAA